MNCNGNVVVFCQINKLLMHRAQVLPVEIQADQRPDLRAQILPHPERIDPTFGGLQRACRHLELDARLARNVTQACRIVRHQIHQHLLHRADHTRAIDNIPSPRAAHNHAEGFQVFALLGNAGIVVVVRRRHRPRLDLFQRRIPERKIAVIPVAAGLVLNPSAVNTPHIHRTVRHVRVQLWPHVGRAHMAKIHAEGLAQPLVIVLLKAIVLLQPAVNARIRKIVDGHAVRLLPSKGREYPFLRGQLLLHRRTPFRNEFPA